MLLGIEIGGTKLQLGQGRGDGTIERLITVVADPRGGAGGIRSQILNAFQEMRLRPEAVGIGFGGPVESDRGVAITSHQVAGWDDFDLAGWARSAFGTDRVAVQNDADTAALGEALHGAGVGFSPVLYVNSGSGIGGGLVVDGRIYRGSGRGAVEIGHLRMSPDGSRTLESLASGWGIADQAKAAMAEAIRHGDSSPGWVRRLGADRSRVTAAMVAQDAAVFPDSEPARILATAAETMGRALAHAVTLLAPRRVILGGGVSQIASSLWLDPIRVALDRHVFPPFRTRFDVVSAHLGQDVVIHGALALARMASSS